MIRRHTHGDGAFEDGFDDDLRRDVTLPPGANVFDTTVKVITEGEGIEYEPPPPSRTPMQRTQDEILDNAVVAAVAAQEAADEALAWMEVIITLPKELRHNLPALLTELGTLISEERRLRQ